MWIPSVDNWPDESRVLILDQLLQVRPGGEAVRCRLSIRQIRNQFRRSHRVGRCCSPTHWRRNRGELQPPSGAGVRATPVRSEGGVPNPWRIRSVRHPRKEAQTSRGRLPTECGCRRSRAHGKVQGMVLGLFDGGHRMHGNLVGRRLEMPAFASEALRNRLGRSGKDIHRIRRGGAGPAGVLRTILHRTAGLSPSGAETRLHFRPPQTLVPAPSRCWIWAAPTDSCCPVSRHQDRPRSRGRFGLCSYLGKGGTRRVGSVRPSRGACAIGPRPLPTSPSGPLEYLLHSNGCTTPH